MCEWSITLGHRRVSQTLPVQFRLHCVSAKLLFEKLRRQKSHERVAQHAIPFTANRRLSADPQMPDSFGNRKRGSGVNLRQTQRVGSKQEGASVTKARASATRDEPHGNIRRWSKRRRVKCARRRRERYERLGMFAIVAARTFLHEHDDVLAIGGAFEFVPITLHEERLGVQRLLESVRS